MKRKAVFVDVDGTLVNHRGLVPESARTAVRRAREHGHLVFLCTGRSPSELWPEIIDTGFDGVVGAAGGYVEVRGQVLDHRPMSEDQVDQVVSFLVANGVHHFLETNLGLFGTPETRARLVELAFLAAPDEVSRAEVELGIGPFIASLNTDPNPSRPAVNKVMFLDSPMPVDRIRDELTGDFVVTPATGFFMGPNSGEISPPGIDKAGGIRTVLEHLGLGVEDTLAFGDGHNDVEMLRYVAVGVAMGNAVDPLLEVADDITDDVDDHGLHIGFARHGLLEPLEIAS